MVTNGAIQQLITMNYDLRPNAPLLYRCGLLSQVYAFGASARCRLGVYAGRNLAASIG